MKARDRLGAVDHKRAARLNGDVAIAGGGPQRPAAVDFRVAGSIDARRQQFQRAALHAVELPRGGCTVAQVDTRAAGQAVHAQHRTVRIQHRRPRQRQAVARRQADAAYPLAAGVHPARHRQAAAVDRQVDVVGAQRIADRQAALLDLEAARPEHAPAPATPRRGARMSRLPARSGTAVPPAS
ncbi:hypothetical protein G6F31_016365 [Rhizopus arrhizus]|nr:hypothetical protein G6F31_016365 [Rhizopus arrhizus]